MTFHGELAQTPIGSLAIRDAIEVRAETLARAAIAQMRTKSLGCAVMVDYGRIPLGIFTEQSVVQLLVKKASLDDRPVQDFADPCFVSVNHREPMERVWHAIQRSGVRFVCVTDDDGRLMGVTGQRGVAEFVAEFFANQVTVQRLGSTPWLQQREGA